MDPPQPDGPADPPAAPIPYEPVPDGPPPPVVVMLDCEPALRSSVLDRDPLTTLMLGR